MIKKHSFANPFPSFRQKFGKNGRSNSAPGAFDVINDRFVFAGDYYSRVLIKSVPSICSKAETTLKLPSLCEDEDTKEEEPQKSLEASDT